MKSFLAVILTTVLFLSGCGGTTSKLITALNAVADASSVSIVVVQGLQAAGKVSPEDGAKAAAYATAVGTAVNQSITALNSTDSNTVKIGKISGYFAAIVVPAFSPEIAPQLPVIISAVTTAIDIFLRNLNGPDTTRMAAAAPRAAIELTSGDKATIKAMQKKIAETASEAALLIPAETLRIGIQHN